MVRTRLRSWLIGLAALALPAAAVAGQAYTTTNVNLRAGPDTDYPVLRWVPQGTTVEVYGCLEDYEWCDVEAMGERGWMHANYLAYPYQQQYVPVVNYGPMLGLPILVFSIDSYWDDHYRRRPWYGDRDRFRHRPDYGRRPDYRDRDPDYYRSPPPVYRPPSQRPGFGHPGMPPPDYHPPRVHPTPRPDYYPPRVNPGPRPDYRPPSARPPGGWQPPPPQAGRPPDIGRPPAPRPPAPPPTARPPNVPHGFGAGGPPRGRDPQGLRNDAGERGGMNSGNF